MENSALPADAKRASILAAARAIFLEQGFQAASMDQIAAAAGASKVTVYSKFGSKEGLFSAIVDGVCEQILAIEIAVPQANSDVEDELTRLAVDYSRVLFDPEVLALVRLAIAEGRAPRRLGALYLRAGPSRARRELVDLFQALTRAGELSTPDAGLAADQFLALIQPQRYFALLDPASRPTEAEVASTARRGVAVFLSHYRPRRSTRQKPRRKP